ncbi:pirin family protein [Actinobacteria bacterium YIM 96077]|uniref:Pirin family protein n=1 Tax=Phytoactinopolyspora halophila TaxID=1981511 RepID=A0A329QTQ2_9ACTN|nr:pirin family protein [Actinobacteria bacterium YIM 96077]RAW15715.1 pirin family protein [Phytoactinopolyspora halophila]
MRGANRFVSTEPGVTSRHSFSFGQHYDPENIGFGLLVMNNDDLLQPGAGYGTHPHRDVEIVTWVLDGALVHRDSTGAGGVVYPGLAQRLSAGRGVRHSEFNDTGSAGDVQGKESPLRFVQMWVPPDEWGREPSYAQCDVTPELTAGGLVTVASGMRRHFGAAAIGLGQSAAAMHVARVGVHAGRHGQTLPGSEGRGDGEASPGSARQPGQSASVGRPDSVVLPGAPYVHVYVTRGSVHVEEIGELGEGDAVRITDEGGRRISATRDAEIIAWEMHADVHAGPPTQ